MLQIRDEIRTADCYRALMRGEYARRRQRNSKYSLRALARDFKISPSFLSEVLNGKAAFSRDQAALWARASRFNQGEAEFFCELVDACDGRTDGIRNTARARLNRLRLDSDVENLKIDAFRLIADWHHFAIIEVLKLHDSQHSPSWLAARLGIPQPAVIDSLHRLERLQFIRKTGQNRFEILKPRSVSGGVPSEFVKNFHASVLEKAVGSLFSQPIDERDFSSTIIAFSSALLPQYRELVAEFRRKIVDLANSAPQKDAVYTLAVQMFRVCDATRDMPSQSEQRRTEH